VLNEQQRSICPDSGPIAVGSAGPPDPGFDTVARVTAVGEASIRWDSMLHSFEDSVPDLEPE
jgi:hypothetical protein